jgi:hypothetical protein
MERRLGHLRRTIFQRRDSEYFQLRWGPYRSTLHNRIAKRRSVVLRAARVPKHQYHIRNF